MSEEDRAAKAARAKALLKKRQQQKTGGLVSVPTPRSASPVISPSPSRSFTPIPQTLVATEQDNRDLGDVFTNTSDASWLESLPRATISPPVIARVSSPPVPAASSTSLSIRTAPPRSVPPVDQEAEAHTRLSALTSENASLNGSLQDQRVRIQLLESQLQQTEILSKDEKFKFAELERRFGQDRAEHEAALRNNQQTISLLVSEKASLLADVQRLEGLESDVHSLEDSLDTERNKNQSLDRRIHQQEAELLELSERAQRAQSNEKDLVDRSREQERKLQQANAELEDTRAKAEDYERKARELEEQIQGDDRVERLESSLANTQERADELEFQLSKLKQSHTSLKAERDELDLQFRGHRDGEMEWKSKYTEIEEQHAILLQQLSSAASEKDALAQTCSDLRARFEEGQRTLEAAQAKSTQATTDLASTVRQLQQTQMELKAASRRAEDAERMQRDLQTEGSTLMRSLDEMRPKIVELSGVKLELGEQIERLQRDVRNRDAAIAQLEEDIDQLRDEFVEAESQWKQSTTLKDGEHASTVQALSEVEKSYQQLQEELETALASIRTLENGRSNHHSETSRQLLEVEQLSSFSKAQASEITDLKRELDSREQQEDEEQEFIRRVQAEIETLRADLNAKDEEIHHLLHSGAQRSEDRPQSLDSEIVKSLRQQHALDLSAAQSQIRALENSVFEAQAHAHSLQKRINTLEDQLPSRTVPHRPFSPGIPSRPASRASTPHDMRRSSIGSHRPSHLAPPLSRSVFDQNLDPETRHKRKVSLSMLKARIDSEVAAAHPSSRANSPMPALPEMEPQTKRSNEVSRREPHSVHRPRFLDESHVFWCHSCHGDLVIL